MLRVHRTDGGAEVDNVGSCVRLSSSLMPNPDMYEDARQSIRHTIGVLLFLGLRLRLNA